MAYTINNIELSSLKRLYRYLEVDLNLSELEQDDYDYLEESGLEQDFEILEGLINGTGSY